MAGCVTLLTNREDVDESRLAAVLETNERQLHFLLPEEALEPVDDTVPPPHDRCQCVVWFKSVCRGERKGGLFAGEGFVARSIKSRQSVSRKGLSSFCYFFWCIFFTAIGSMETLLRLPPFMHLSMCFMSYRVFCVFNHRSVYIMRTLHSGTSVKNVKNLLTAETDIRKRVFSSREVPFFTHNRYKRVLEIVVNLMCHEL